MASVSWTATACILVDHLVLGLRRPRQTDGCVVSGLGLQGLCCMRISHRIAAQRSASARFSSLCRRACGFTVCDSPVRACPFLPPHRRPGPLFCLRWLEHLATVRAPLLALLAATFFFFCPLLFFSFRVVVLTISPFLSNPRLLADHRRRKYSRTPYSVKQQL